MYKSVMITASEELKNEFLAVKESHDDVTHYSVYLRDTDGEVYHEKHFECFGAFRNGAKDEAIHLAVKLSMEHAIFIEPIQ